MKIPIRHRPGGITLLAVLFGIGGVFTLFLKILSLVVITLHVKNNISDFAVLMAIANVIVGWGL